MSDVTDGVCRSIEFSTQNGPIGVMVCKKDGTRYELYLQYYPQSYFEVCVGAGCVSKNPSIKGFDSFTAEELEPVDTGYNYRDPSTFSPSCNYGGENCDISHDETSGVCRIVISKTIDGELIMLACHKDDSRYELYRVLYPTLQSFNACLGPLCIDELKGFDSYVIPANETQNNETEEPPLTLQGCLMDVPMAVDNGFIEFDNIVGDNRYLVWASPPDMRLAWITASKNGTLEITRDWTNGYEGLNFSEDFCMQLDAGTLCVNPHQNRIASLNSTCPVPDEQTLDIRLFPGFPTDHKAVFECVAEGFSPPSYSWDFGDGAIATTQTYDAYHTFPDKGTYTVACSANGLNASMQVNVTVPFSPSLIQGENVHLNSTFTVGGSIGEQWGTYLILVNQTNRTATLFCGEIGHRTHMTLFPYWQIPEGLSIVNEEQGRRLITLQANETGNFSIRCGIGVSEPIYYQQFWVPDSPLFHNGLPAISWGSGTITGYGGDLTLQFS